MLPKEADLASINSLCREIHRDVGGFLSTTLHLCGNCGEALQKDIFSASTKVVGAFFRFLEHFRVCRHCHECPPRVGSVEAAAKLLKRIPRSDGAAAKRKLLEALCILKDTLREVKESIEGCGGDVCAVSDPEFAVLGDFDDEMSSEEKKRTVLVVAILEKCYVLLQVCSKCSRLFSEAPDADNVATMVSCLTTALIELGAELCPPQNAESVGLNVALLHKHIVALLVFLDGKLPQDKAGRLLSHAEELAVLCEKIA